MTGQLMTSGTVMSAVMVVLWYVQWRRRDASLVDVAWSFGMAFQALFLAATGSGDPARRAVLSGLATAWAVRLAVHLLNDRVLGKPEDSRYQNMRRGLGARAQLGFFVFFQAQALVAVIFAVPLAVVVHHRAAFGGVWDWLAIAVWITAVVGESVADAQLAQWRAEPANRGRTCRAGLWRYSRHPNYFCEWLHWWTYVLLAIGDANWWLALLCGPVLMYVFLNYLTGVPFVEQQALANRPDYAEYQRGANRFFPWFPRSKASAN